MILLFSGPLLADLTALIGFFYINVQAVRMGIPPRMQSLVGGLYAVAYTVGSPRRADAVMAAALAAVAACWTAAMVRPRFGLFLAVGAMAGAAASHYFVTFQVKMHNVRPFRTLAWTIAAYNISWGTGYSAGPFICGWLMSRHAAWLVAILWALALAVAVLPRLVRATESDASVDPGVRQDFHSTPPMRLSGWIGIGAASILFNGLVCTLWPGLGDAWGLTNRQIGLGTLVGGLQIPLSSLLWARLRRWMSGPWLLGVLLVLTGLGFGTLPLVRPWPGSLLPLSLFGFAYTGVIFHAVYYSNADPRNAAHSVGINEAAIGAGGILGPLVMGGLAWSSAASWRPYAGGALLMLGAVVAAGVIWKRHGRCAAGGHAV
jgi:predicted MFS family arabinose efflux permease